MTDLLPFLPLLPAPAGQALAAALVALALALAAGALAADRSARRRRAIEARLARYCRAGEAAAPSASPLSRLSAAAADVVRPVLSTLSAGLFAREKDREAMRGLLRAAGYRDASALSWLALAKAVGALLVGGGSAWAIWGAGMGPDHPAFRFAAPLGALVLGAALPEYGLKIRRDARQDEMRAALPDAIDLMVIAAYAGQSLDMALDRVSRELAPFAPALADELGVTTAELQVLPDRAEALRHLEDRTGLREVKSFALTLIQTIRYGAPFAESLKALGGDLRQARMIAAEERGAKLPALLTLPLILFIMPAVFVVVVGPAILSMSSLFSM